MHCGNICMDQNYNMWDLLFEISEQGYKFIMIYSGSVFFNISFCYDALKFKQIYHFFVNKNK